MGRELRRKEAKKNKGNVAKTEEVEYNVKGSTFFIIAISIILILLVSYYVVAVFVTKEINVTWGDNTETSETENNEYSDRILAKNMFNQSEEKYYVYFYDFTSKETDIYTALSQKENVKLYRVDTNSALNKNYVTEETGNRKVTSVSNLKVKEQTLIEVTNDKVTAYYEGTTEIFGFIGKN